MGSTSSVPSEESATPITPNDERTLVGVVAATSQSPPSDCPMHASNVEKKPLPTECPMHQSNVEKKPLPSDCPMHAGSVATNESKAPPISCPMHADNSKENDIDPLNMMPPPNQRPSPGQPFLLNTNRQTSTIPRGGEHEGKNWQYPSEQMFWNAMLRKGWRWEKEALSQDDMKHIINIHNVNNERAWEEILLWESFHRESEPPKLLKFGGRAKDYSPRARLRALMGHDLPFDRHDWVVDRNGKHVRYVIDYYDIGDENGYKTGEFVELDVRPAYDSFGSVIDRSRVALLRKAAGVYQWWKGQPEESKQINEQ